MKKPITNIMLIIGLTLTFFSQFAAAADLTIVAGGGYKKPMQTLIAHYQKTTGKQVNASYSNMRQILAQAKASSKIALVVGDKRFLSKTDLFNTYQPLGEGKLVIAWANGSPPIKKASDLNNSLISRVAMPHAKKAIYGRAASEWLKSKKLNARLQDVLMQASTIPQVSSYLVAREIDVGFINLTDAIGLGDRIGGYTSLNDGYSKIEIVAGMVKGYENNTELKAFQTFLASKQAKEIFEMYGL